MIMLDKLGEIKASQAVWERGREYYMDNHVRYICVDGGKGRAIVEGEHAYEVEFDFADGETEFCLLLPLRLYLQARGGGNDAIEGNAGAD